MIMNTVVYNKNISIVRAYSTYTSPVHKSILRRKYYMANNVYACMDDIWVIVLKESEFWSMYWSCFGVVDLDKGIQLMTGRTKENKGQATRRKINEQARLTASVAENYSNTLYGNTIHLHERTCTMSGIIRKGGGGFEPFDYLKLE